MKERGKAKFFGNMSREFMEMENDLMSLRKGAIPWR
jgi:hypothetical protein